MDLYGPLYHRIGHWKLLRVSCNRSIDMRVLNIHDSFSSLRLKYGECEMARHIFGLTQVGTLRVLPTMLS